jgi:preprotein translocase subunit SecE
MAKTRAQRKAERRAREQQESKGNGVSLSESQAQHDTQVGRSGDIAEIEAVEAGIAAGAPESELETPDAPKSKSPRAQKRELAKQEKAVQRNKASDAKRREKDQLAKRQKQAAAERQRGGVTGFIASCWAELKKVQWPDRETLVQATAVTIIFVAIAAAYLGALDALFSRLIKVVL